MSGGYPIRPARNGEPASAGVINRLPLELYSIITGLSERVDAAALGEYVATRDQPIAAGVADGMPVYWDPSYGVYAPALDGTVSEGGRLAAARSARVAGVAADCRGRTATIVTGGSIAVDLSGVIVGPPGEGYVFLSAATPGRVEVRSGGAGVLVGLYAAGRLTLATKLRANAYEHEHLRFPMACRPAGDYAPPAGAGPAVVDNPDPSLPGWLPAGHASFGGNAPAGATFGYNLAAHPDLQRSWPPVPLEGADLLWYRDLTPYTTAGFIPRPPDEEYYALDGHGIWWMRDNPDAIPWPNIPFSGGDSGSAFDLADPTQPETDDGRFMTMSVAYTMPVGDNASGTVLRITMPASSPLQYVGPDGEPAETGALCGVWNWNRTITTQDAPGFVAIKGLDADGNFLAGPVVEEVAVTGLLTAQSDSTVVRGGRTFYRGRITLGANLNPNGDKLFPLTIKLVDAEEARIAYLPATALPAGKTSSIILTFQVPGAARIAAGTPVRFALSVAGRAVGTLPSLAAGYGAIPSPGAGESAVPTSLVVIPIATAAPITAVNNCRRFQATATFPVNPDDFVVIEVKRFGPDSYSGAVVIYNTELVIGG